MSGLRLEDVAAELDCSRSKVSRIENGMGLARVIELRAMLDQYGVTDEQERAHLLGALRKATEEGWWEQPEYDQVLPAGLGVYVGLENDARRLQSWELGWVPGLLQTEDYMRAVLSHGRSKRTSEIDALMAIRKKRQARLDGSDCLELWAIIDETVLLRPVGGADVMRAQAAHLAAEAERPNATLQVLPLAKGMHPGSRGSFSILSFGLAEVTIYVESPGCSGAGPGAVPGPRRRGRPKPPTRAKTWVGGPADDGRPVASPGSRGPGVSTKASWGPGRRPAGRWRLGRGVRPRRPTLCPGPRPAS
ncbi:helix-turn-helix transcriptional regulator [Embleya sp. NPDC020886]|uniref:helix-turn-helix transcriptional regulator n=1 Tax=Embleya sp. NPDC020886 TaxID=3363980 RepID=UPI0037B33433